MRSIYASQASRAAAPNFFHGSTIVRTGVKRTGTVALRTTGNLVQRISGRSMRRINFFSRVDKCEDQLTRAGPHRRAEEVPLWNRHVAFQLFFTGRQL